MRVADVFRKRDRLTRAKLDHIIAHGQRGRQHKADHAELTALREQVRSLQARLAKVVQERDRVLDRFQEIAAMFELPLDHNLEKVEDVLRAVCDVLAEAVATCGAERAACWP